MKFFTVKLIFIQISILSALISFILNFLNLNISDAASWIQAVGSIYSIITTLIIFLLQDWYKNFKEKEIHRRNVEVFVGSCISIILRYRRLPEQLGKISQEIREKGDVCNEIAVMSDLLDVIFNDEFKSVYKILSRDAITSCRYLNGSVENVNRIIYVGQILNYIYKNIDKLKCHIDNDIGNFDEYYEKGNEYIRKVKGNIDLMDEQLRKISKR